MDAPLIVRIRTAWGVWRRARHLPDENGRWGTELHWTAYLRRGPKWPDDLENPRMLTPN
jgi:hypothetical protein